jgi:hypothetical protein
MSIVARLLRRQGKPELPGDDPVLRAALEIPPAPGEEASYRRLMAVIAEDTLVRQPVPAYRHRAWAPALSAAAAMAVLLVLAYDLGLHRGQELMRFAQTQTPAPVVKPDVPVGAYVPPAKPPASAVKPAPKPSEKPAEPATRPQASPTLLASLIGGGLSQDQKDLLASAQEAMDARDWKSAAQRLVSLAEADPQSDAAITALHAAGMILSRYANDAEGASALFTREAEACEAMLQTETDPVRTAWLQEKLDAAKAAAGPPAEATPQ